MLIMKPKLSGLLIVALIIAIPASSQAVTKCKVKVDRKTGVIKVDARDVVGSMLWGGAAGEETSAFFNESSCVVGTKARRCTLAAEGTVEAITPPSTCFIHLADDGADSCAAFISGCTPGVRDAADVSDGVSCWDVDENGLCDLVTEDINTDGACDVLDCEGPQGSPGADGAAGTPGADGSDGAPGTPGADGADGAPGTPGAAGNDGVAATVSVGPVSTGSPGTPAAVANSGSATSAVLDFTIPTGADGSPGSQGLQGDPGATGGFVVSPQMDMQLSQVSASTMTGVAAAAYCDSLVESGHSDWALPTWDETLYGFSGGATVPGGIQMVSFIWTRTPDPGDPTSIAYVVVRENLQSASTDIFVNDLRLVRCVRWEQDLSSVVPAPAPTPGSSATDISLKAPESGQASEAVYCADLIEDGFDDWRLPTIAELTYALSGGLELPEPRQTISLVVRSVDSTQGWYVKEDTAIVTNNPGAGPNVYVRCVR